MDWSKVYKTFKMARNMYAGNNSILEHHEIRYFPDGTLSTT